MPVHIEGLAQNDLRSFNQQCIEVLTFALSISVHAAKRESHADARQKLGGAVPLHVNAGAAQLPGVGSENEQVLVLLHCIGKGGKPPETRSVLEGGILPVFDGGQIAVRAGLRAPFVAAHAIGAAEVILPGGAEVLARCRSGENVRRVAARELLQVPRE